MEYPKFYDYINRKNPEYKNTPQGNPNYMPSVPPEEVTPFPEPAVPVGTYGHYTHSNHTTIPMPSDTPSLGFATVPMQKLNTLYTCEEALMKGTDFHELDMPYTHKSAKRG